MTMDTAISSFAEADNTISVSFPHYLRKIGIFLACDGLLFIALLITYITSVGSGTDTLAPNTAAYLPYAIMQTLFMLAGSLTYAMLLIAMQRKETKPALFWLNMTLLFGIAFICLQFNGVCYFLFQDTTPFSNATTFSFFALITMHCIQVALVMCCIIYLAKQIYYCGMTTLNQTYIVTLSLYWYFLNILWIGVIFTVYVVNVF